MHAIIFYNIVAKFAAKMLEEKRQDLWNKISLDTSYILDFLAAAEPFLVGAGRFLEERWLPVAGAVTTAVEEPPPPALALERVARPWRPAE